MQLLWTKRFLFQSQFKPEALITTIVLTEGWKKSFLSPPQTVYLHYGKNPVDETLQTVSSFCLMSHWKNPTISCLTDERKMLLRRQINTRGEEFYIENVRIMCQTISTTIQQMTTQQINQQDCNALTKITHSCIKKTGLLQVLYVPYIHLTVIYLHLSNIIFSIQKVRSRYSEMQLLYFSVLFG